MEQKDYILREIEKIGVLLRYLIRRILPDNSPEQREEVYEMVDTELEKNFGLDLERLAESGPDQFNVLFREEKGYSLENIELLADLLYTLSSDHPPESRKLMKRALEMYEYVNIRGRTFSLEREEKIKHLKTRLLNPG